jgi:hypothetical protein
MSDMGASDFSACTSSGLMVGPSCWDEGRVCRWLAETVFVLAYGDGTTVNQTCAHTCKFTNANSITRSFSRQAATIINEFLNDLTPATKTQFFM